MVTLFVVAVAGIFSFLISKEPPWNILLSNFIYFLGITQGALVVAVILRLSSAKWSNIFYRLASPIALAFLPIGTVMLITILLFKDSIFYWTDKAVYHHPWFDISFFMIRSIVPFLLFYLIAWLLFRNSQPQYLLRNPRYYKIISDETAFNKLHIRLGFLLLIAFVVNETFFSWDLGMTLNPHYAETVYSVLYIGSSVLGGTAALIVLMWFSKNYLDVKVFKAEQFSNMSQFLLGLVLIVGYLRFSQFFPIWYANMPLETKALYLKIFSAYKPVFALALTFTGVIPFILLIFSKIRSSDRALSIVSGFILVGLWLDSYLATTPPLAEKHVITNTFILSPVNIVFSLGVLSGFIFLLTYFFLKNPRSMPATEEAVEDDMLVVKAEGWQ